MDPFPGPRDADRANEAEARTRNLKARFRRVSDGFDRRKREGFALTPLEILILSGVGFFVMWLVWRLAGF